MAELRALAVPLALVAVQRVLERGPEVAVLAAQLAEPLKLVGVRQVLGEVACLGQVAGDEPVADRGLARLTR